MVTQRGLETNERMSHSELLGVVLMSECASENALGRDNSLEQSRRHSSQR